MKKFLLFLFILVGASALAQQQLSDEELDFIARIYELEDGDDEEAFYQAEQEFMDYLAEKKDWARFYNVWLNKVVYQINNDHFYRSYTEIGRITDDIQQRGMSQYAYIPHQGLGLYYVKRGHHQMGERYFMKALQAIDTVNNKLAQANVYFLLTLALSNTDPDRALAYLDSLPVSSDNVRAQSGALSYRCLIHFERGDMEAFDDSYRQYDSLLTLHPDYVGSTNYNNVMVYRCLRQGDYEGALAWCDSLGAETSASHQRTTVYAYMGDWQRAYREVLRRDSIDQAKRNEVLEEDIEGLVHDIEVLEMEKERNKNRVKNFAMLAFVALVLVAVLVALHFYRRRKHRELIHQYKLLDESRQQTRAAQAIRRAFVMSMDDRLKSPVNVLRGYARIFNNPNFTLTDAQNDKSYPDIVAAAKSVEALIAPVLASYMHETDDVDGRRQRLCEGALRSPLNALIGMAEMIAEDKDHLIAPDELMQMRKEIASCASQVAEATHEFLFFSVTDADTTFPMTDSVGLNELAQSTLGDYGLRNLSLQKQFTTSVADDVVILTSQRPFQTIINCLLSNADKHGSGTSIDVSCRQEADGTYTVAVANEGSLPADVDDEQLFQPFWRIDNSQPGMGLGLPLARKLARCLGYDVERDRSVDHGICFVVKGIA